MVQNWLERKAPQMDYHTHIFFQPSRPEAEIIGEYFRMVDRLLEPSAYLARAYRSILAMRPTRSALATKNGGAPSSPAGPPHQKDSGDYLNDIRRFSRLAWSQGVKSSCRVQFWRQLYGIWQKNPSRLVRYLTTCAYGEDLFRFREALLREVKNLKTQEEAPRLAAAAS